MPYDDPDPTDPMTLHGVAVETEDDSAMREMAECFVEEYARLGCDAIRIMRIFQTPGYAGPYMAYRALGEAAIQSLLEDHMALRNHRSSKLILERTPDGRVSLPVLQE
ncbi:MAG: hypothetical protein HOP29_12530 [Phycisphaerales bacterium]|nr:hypothetical protein [Phycisphaerales bacterium]